MNAVEVEVCGGPEDGRVFSIPTDAWDISFPVPVTIAEMHDPEVMPRFRTLTFTVHQRRDGRRYINWYEGT